MCGMLEQQHHTSEYEDQLKTLFNTPPNPFMGEVPATDKLVDAVFIETKLLELPTSMPYFVPLNYMQSPINMPQQKLTAWPRTVIVLAQAACIVLFISLSFLPFYKSSTLSTTSSAQFISSEDARWYIENQTMSNELFWFEWEEKVVVDESLAMQSSHEILNTLTPEDVNSFF